MKAPDMPSKQEQVDREARRVLEPLRYSPVACSERETEAESASVANLARLIEQAPAQRRARQARQRWQRTALFSGAGGLALAAAALLWVSSDGADTREAPGAQLTLLEGQLSHKGAALANGVTYSIGTLGRLRTPTRSGAHVVTNEGIRVDFDADSTADLTFTEQTRRVALNRGKLQLSVPKLDAGTSLSVATPDAVVTVHGTEFSVEIKNSTTCVRVTEGRVSVARGDALELLTRGMQSGCKAPEVVPTAKATPSTPPPTRSAQTARATRPSTNSNSGTARGTLDQENHLFRRALAAEQAGQRQQAERLARHLLQRYPDAPMAPEAKRILRRVENQRARADDR